MKRGFVIAIDGPVAAGKSTLAEELALELNGFYFCTGGLLRGLALYCLEAGVALSNSKAVSSVLDQVVVELSENNVFLNGRDVTKRLKDPDIAQPVSIVSAIPAVRREMVKRWRMIGEQKIAEGLIVVAEGRDVATAIFPHAAMKIFLTASPEIRARRRLEDVEKLGSDMSLEEVIADIKVRDERDMNRSTAPLVRDPEHFGYFILDDSNMTKKQTVAILRAELHKRGLA